MSPAIDLTTQQRSVLLAVFAEFTPPVERVDVYGSRATGTARAGSDVDLIVAGQIDWSLCSRIRGAIDESYLSIFADVTAYELLVPGGFRDEVIRTAKTLFAADDLRRAAEAARRAA